MRLFACEIADVGHEAEHRVAYALLQVVVQEVYGMALPEIARDAHGKPYFPKASQIQFNLSHCKDLAICGIGEKPLGVDVESIRPLRQGVLRRAFSEEEAVAVRQSDNADMLFFRHWTLKESYVKAIGVGISHPLREVQFRLDCDWIYASVTGWQFRQFLLRDKWIASCCVSEQDTLPDGVHFRTIS